MNYFTGDGSLPTLPPCSLLLLIIYPTLISLIYSLFFHFVYIYLPSIYLLGLGTEIQEGDTQGAQEAHGPVGQTDRN